MLIYGIDEAGYGPNLGPLVISATLWDASTENLTVLFEPLRKAGIIIGDSKKVYHAGGSLKTLETSVLVALRALGQIAEPVVADEEKITELTKAFLDILSEHGVRLLNIESRIIEPIEFNKLLKQYDSKAALLSNETLQLAVKLNNKIAERQTARSLFLCDKHGGRNRYLDLLTEYYPDEFVQIKEESRARSVYRWQNKTDPCEFRFLMKGETQFPVALASMVSKYRRELAMKQFNEFWKQHIPNLEPTAGYPEDAKRFMLDIATARMKLGIDHIALWREK